MISSKKSIQISFGKKVRDLRLKNSYSQEAFAFECGLYRTYVDCIERGEKNITIINIGKIAKALNIEIYKLFQE